MGVKCDYVFKAGKRAGEICGRGILIDGSKCGVHSEENIGRKREYNRIYNQRLRKSTEPDEQSQQKSPPTERQQQPTESVDNVKELLTVMKINNNLMATLVLLLNSRKNKKESTI